MSTGTAENKTDRGDSADDDDDDDVEISSKWDAGGADDVCLFVGCLTSQQHASVSQGRICSDNFTCYHTEIEAADHTFLPHPVTVY